MLRNRDSGDSVIRHAATAIRTYNVVHTGPKIQPGGLNDGFARLRYHPGISGAVHRPPKPPTARHPTIHSTSQSHRMYTRPSGDPTVAPPTTYVSRRAPGVTTIL